MGQQGISRSTLVLGYLSASASVVASVTIVAFFTIGQPWGTFNDFSYGVMALSMVPAMASIRRALARSATGLGKGGWIFGLVSFTGYAVLSFLQTLRDVSLIDFGQLELFPGLGPLALGAVFFVLLDVSPIILGVALRRVGVGNALKMGLIAATGLGYPLWAAWLVRSPSVWAPA